MTYSDLFFFGKWYLQLWSEGIGKNSKGITPIHSLEQQINIVSYSYI